ncbi:MAG: response regulator [Verrucomicrobia bacterium]|nr:response regulator [Verrucomicrobiota bacterium]
MTETDLVHLETRLHELEHQVLKAQRFMHDFIESARLMVIGLDREGRITIFNRKAEETTGYAKEDVLGSKLSEVFGPEHGSTMHTLAEQFEVCGGHGFRCETQVVLASGEQRTIVWHSSCLTDEDEVVGLMAFGEDRTAEKWENDRRRWFDRMSVFQQFSGEMAHGFNNLLGMVLGYASLLRGLCLPGSIQHEYAEQVEEGIRRSAQVLWRLLEFARGGAPKPERFDVGERVGRALDDLRRGAPHGVELTYTAPKDTVQAVSDPRQLDQVLGEVVQNAFESMSDGGRVEVSVGAAEMGADWAAQRPGLEAGSYAVVRVADSGPGVMPDHAFKLFEPFTTTKQTRCAGLGLSIAYGVIRRNRGWIELGGTPGAGTTVSLYLPIDGVVAEQTAERHAQRKGPQTILLVDDESTLVETVSDMLRHLGYLVLTAADGDEAVQIYEEHRANVDLIILDMMMPRKSGAETYEALKRIEPEVKVLLTSGFEQQKAVAEGMCDEGAAGFVEKPYRLKDLSQFVRRAIERHA